MQILHHYRKKRTRSSETAVATFVAALSVRKGRIVTASSDPDSWKRKHPLVRQRLERERA